MPTSALTSSSQTQTQNTSKLNDAKFTTATTAPAKHAKQVPWTQHALRQLKLVIPGAVLTYYLGTLNDFWHILQGAGGSWARISGFGAFGLGFTTIALFLYVLFMPWLTGEEPNYQTWRESGILSSVIPLLTGSIVLGWLLAVSTLGQWSPLGYVKGTIGVSAFYALTFGLLGLIPIPRITRKQKL